MKIKKKLGILFASLALGAALTACGGAQGGRVAYIGADAAKALALELAGLTTGQTTAVTADMDTRDGLDYYRVEVIADGKYYRYDVDALTGTVIASETPQDDPVESSKPADWEYVWHGTAPPIELGGGAESPAPVNTPAPADTPAPVSTPAPVNTPASGLIGEEKAKQIALNHAGLTESQVTFVRGYLDRDDGRQVYDVEFYVLDGQVAKEYDYEIDAVTGAIRDVDYDAEYYSRPVSTPAPQTSGKPQSGGSITADRAKEIALAQVPGATTANIREFETDYDDGRLEYEGTIVYNKMEYEFEIDGYSGAIRSWDVESVYD